MYFTTKSRYAIQVMLDLALWENKKLRQREEIALEHRIPQKYMDQIIFSLKKGNLVTTQRGPKGGLKIGKPCQNISLWNIFECVEKNVKPVSCLHENFTCTIGNSCISKTLWEDVYLQIKTSLSSYQLSNYIKKNI